jgi:hypothetical protein
MYRDRNDNRGAVLAEVRSHWLVMLRDRHDNDHI